VVTSDLTLVECDRAILRARMLGVLSDSEAAHVARALTTATGSWNLLRVDRDVVERARRPFPAEPLRTLDALHVASAMVARSAVVGLSVLSLDRRVREAAAELGFPIVPETG
jgi:hypothetical protein